MQDAINECRLHLSLCLAHLSFSPFLSPYTPEIMDPDRIKIFPGDTKTSILAMLHEPEVRITLPNTERWMYTRLHLVIEFRGERVFLAMFH